ncbi:hypothetical protein BU17DRAFT_62968 [Hysterangium stoloniferum]|nr:hypothetical protein BU17DRAFT_64126 [Hysterangium stoloniferum]KAF8525277.1 hypothetical protein BU17DRAFT_62968 [Hysterangium stoloniferum]
MSKTAINMKISPQALKERNDLRENEELFAKFPLALSGSHQAPLYPVLNDPVTTRFAISTGRPPQLAAINTGNPASYYPSYFNTNVTESYPNEFYSYTSPFWSR